MWKGTQRYFLSDYLSPPPFLVREYEWPAGWPVAVPDARVRFFLVLRPFLRVFIFAEAVA